MFKKGSLAIKMAYVRIKNKDDRKEQQHMVGSESSSLQSCHYFLQSNVNNVVLSLLPITKLTFLN
jgi:hypothetical protein